MSKLRITTLLIAFGFMACAQADELSKCADIESDEARLECYDRASRLEAAPESVDLAPTASAKPAETMQEELFGKSPEEAKAAIAEAAGMEDIQEIRATVVSVVEDGRGRIYVVLDNEQRWRQVRKEYFKVGVGDEVVIREAMLNSYSMQRASGGRKTKVRRID